LNRSGFLTDLIFLPQLGKFTLLIAEGNCIMTGFLALLGAVHFI